jgi:hypothetical protein
MVVIMSPSQESMQDIPSVNGGDAPFIPFLLLRCMMMLSSSGALKGK